VKKKKGREKEHGVEALMSRHEGAVGEELCSIRQRTICKKGGAVVAEKKPGREKYTWLK